MRDLRRVFRITFLLLIVLAAASVAAQAQSLIWRNDWTLQAPPTFRYDVPYPYLYYLQQEPFVFTPDGDVLMRTPTLVGQDDQIVRFTASGAERWRVNLGSLGSVAGAGYSPMVGYADGSAIAASQAGFSVVKIGADGTIKWASMQGVYALAPLANQAVAVLGCNTLSALDAQTGQLLWKHEFPGQSGRCVASGVLADAAGNSYATFSTSSSDGSFRLVKFDLTGNVLWQRDSSPALVPMSWPAVPFGVSDSVVYVTSGYRYPNNVLNNELATFAVNDGTPGWALPGAQPLCMAGTPTEPIVITANGVERRATDGHQRWVQPAVSGAYATCNGNQVIVGNTAMDATSGAVLWNSSLPSADQDGNAVEYVTSGVVSDGAVVFAGVSYYGSQQPFLQRVDAVSGHTLNPFTMSLATQSFLANSTLIDAQTIASAATIPIPTGTEMHTRVLEVDTGALRWEATALFDSNLGDPSWTGFTGAGSAIAVTVTQPHGIWAGAYDRVSGSKRWSTLLYNLITGQSQTVSYDPLADKAGNVFLSYGARVPCYPWMTCTQLSVVKLNAADGSIAWQHDDLFPVANGQIFPATITMVGSDVIVASKFASPYTTSSLLKLSGTDGSVAWASSVFYLPNSANSAISGVFPIADGNIIVTGPGWAKVNANTGATIWSNPQANCGVVCFSYQAAVLPDGSLVAPAQDNQRMWITSLPAVAGATAINWYPDQSDTNATRSFVNSFFRDSAGALWTRIGRRYGRSDTIYYLAKFDIQTGMFASQQALLIYSADPLLQWASPFMLAAPENNQFPAFININNPPDPFVSGNALVDSSITANGSLSVQIIKDHAFVRDGDVLNFHLLATYSGDAPISGARLLADFPWTGFATGLSCVTQSAANCQLDTRASSIVADFDIQPGGQIDIGGSIRVTANSSVATLHALVAGPIGLNELNTNDNGISVLVDQSVFADGFE